MYHMPDSFPYLNLINYFFISSSTAAAFHKMNGILSLLLTVFFVFQHIVGARTRLIISETRNELVALAPSSDDANGICKLIVESWGYVCEEHTVNLHSHSILPTLYLQYNHHQSQYIPFIKSIDQGLGSS